VLRPGADVPPLLRHCPRWAYLVAMTQSRALVKCVTLVRLGVKEFFTDFFVLLLHKHNKCRILFKFVYILFGESEVLAVKVNFIGCFAVVKKFASWLDRINEILVTQARGQHLLTDSW